MRDRPKYINFSSFSIGKDLKANWLFLTLFFVGGIPQIFNNYALYIWFFLLVVYWYKRSVTFNRNACIIVLFCFFYCISRQLYNPTALSNSLFNLTYPFIMYEGGIYICKKIKNPYAIIIILFGIIISFASWSIISNTIDFLDTGMIVNPKRVVDTEGKDFEHIIPATQHNSMLSIAIGGIGIIFIKANNSFQRNLKLSILIFSIISLMASLHLLNRSAIVIAVMALIVGYLWSGVNGKKIFFSIFAAFILLIFVIIVFKDSIIFESIVEGFTNRELNENNGGMESGGGRFQRWVLSPYSILTHPLGSKGLFYHGKYVMAHNTWLDIGIDSGIIAFILIMIITYRFYKSLYYVLNQKQIPSFYRGFILLISIGICLQFAVEPLLQAFYPLFYLLFFIWGLLDKNLSYKRLNKTQIKSSFSTFQS